MTTLNEGEIICQEVLITTSENMGKVYKPNGNMLLFDPPTKILNKHAWAVRNTITGDTYAAVFNGINASKMTKNFETIVIGKLHGIDVEGKETNIMIIGNEHGIEGIELEIV